MIIAAAVREMIALGLAGEALIAAIARIEAAAIPDKPRSKHAEAQARYAEKKRSALISINSHSDQNDQPPSPLSPSPSSPLLPPNNPLPLSPLPLSSTVADATRRTIDSDFQEFWKAYPKRDGANPKAPARKSFLAALKAGIEASAIIAGARACAARDRDKIGTPFIPQAVKWLRDKRWEDYAATGPPDAPKFAPPPGMKSYEETMQEFRNGASGTGVRRDTGVGQNGADHAAELQLSGRGPLQIEDRGAPRRTPDDPARD